MKNLTETLAVEWGPYGIRVNGLVPGMFPHEDEATHITGACPTGGRPRTAAHPRGASGTPRDGMGRGVPVLAVGELRDGPHDGRGRCELAARHLLMPEFTPIREQLGKEPFTLE